MRAEPVDASGGGEEGEELRMGTVVPELRGFSLAETWRPIGELEVSVTESGMVRLRNPRDIQPFGLVSSTRDIERSGLSASVAPIGSCPSISLSLAPLKHDLGRVGTAAVAKERAKADARVGRDFEGCLGGEAGLEGDTREASCPLASQDSTRVPF